MDKKMKIVLGLLVLYSLVSTQLVNASPIDKDEEDYLSDKSDNNYDDDDFDDENAEADRKASTASSANDEEYITQKYTELTEAGKSVTLKCPSDNFDESTMSMWYNGTLIILQGTYNTDPERLSYSKKDGSLTIKNLTPYDDTNYKCRTFPKNLRYQIDIELQVSGPPTGISISHNKHDQKNIADETLVYKAGEHDLEFRCNIAKARPGAKIDWIHNGNTILESQGKDHDLRVEDNLLVIKTLHARHAGEYQCEASNEHGNLKAAFKIEAQYVPFFTHHRSYFNAEEGADAEIHCLYKSFPAPTSVKWLKGGSRIHDNDKYKIDNDMKEHHDRTKLLIRNVNKTNDLITYQCEVTNDLGSKIENVSLGFEPAPAKFVGYKYINKVVYTDWIVKSRQQLTGMQILYRNNENGWRPRTAIITNLYESREGEWRVQGSIDNMESGDWSIIARMKNTEGWTDDRVIQETEIKIPKGGLNTEGAGRLWASVVGLWAPVVDCGRSNIFAHRKRIPPSVLRPPVALSINSAATI